MLSLLGMDSGRVETTCRHAIWKIENMKTTTLTSDSFRIGEWNWFLSIDKPIGVANAKIGLFPDIKEPSKERVPISSFVIRVMCSTGEQRMVLSSTITNEVLRRRGDFCWEVKGLPAEKLRLDVEFLDLKIRLDNDGELKSIWDSNGNKTHTRTSMMALSVLRRMYSDNAFFDVTIEASNGIVGAHRAILASSSPVFRCMFDHDLKEKQESKIQITDMKVEDCRALVSYLYGTLEQKDFVNHRLGLLKAADKYDVPELKEACEKSLVEDKISKKNIFTMMELSCRYELQNLKSNCLQYLKSSSNISDIRDNMGEFLKNADRDVVRAMLREFVNIWKDF